MVLSNSLLLLIRYSNIHYFITSLLPFSIRSALSYYPNYLITRLPIYPYLPWTTDSDTQTYLSRKSARVAPPAKLPMEMPAFLIIHLAILIRKDNMVLAPIWRMQGYSPFFQRLARLGLHKSTMISWESHPSLVQQLRQL